MARYLLKRLAMMLLTLLIVITLTFFLMKLIPGSPLGNVMKLNHAQQVAVEKQYGLNQPVWRQYLTYLAGAVHGNFGMSYQYTGTSVASLIMRRVGPSVIISLQALVVGTAAGIVLGSLGALHKGRWQDSLTATLAVVGISFPSFILAILLQYYLGFKLQLFPVADWQGLMSTVLPTLALAAVPMAQVSRFVRTEMVEVLASDYILLAQAKGLSMRQVVWRHALKNSIIPALTLIGPLAVSLITGSMVVENIFSVPGIGELFINSVLANDYPVIMGLTMFYCLLLCGILLVTDLVYGLVDPRILAAEKGEA
ncbi:ABC transporter permease [Limosilactobacillus ingluviei]|uniref:ABC transporter permease n=1 Tax=Limosilactobacillus ingluviei TaxID=148604 RepID=UPI0024BB34D2|nr:ABC transporter permease [Limosilactobacillus ingluviei]